MSSIVARLKNCLAFSLIELMVVIAIIALISVVAMPTYKTYVNKTHVTEMVNKLASFKLNLIDTYLSTGAWPSSLNGSPMVDTTPDSFFNDAVSFHYNTGDNKAWFGYKLSPAYGDGWIFMLLIANPGGVFETHCGSLESGCDWGDCNSLKYFPDSCSEVDLSATYNF